MANGTNTNKYDILKELNAKAFELKTKYKEDLHQKVFGAYGEIAMTDLGNPDFKGKPKFGLNSDVKAELMVSGGNFRNNKIASNKGFLKEIEKYNSIIDKAVSELAASIDGYGKNVIQHVNASKTTKEQDRQRWANKEEFKNLTFDDGRNYKHSDIKKTLEDYITEFIDEDVDSNHGLNSNGTLEDFRYSVLEKLSNEGSMRDNYESWDLSEEFVREKLVNGTPGGYTSDFVSDETLAELNKLSVLSKDQYNKYEEYAAEQMNKQTKEKNALEQLINPETRNNELYEDRFNKYVEQKRKNHLEIARKHNEAVLSLRENKKKVARATNEINKSKELAKAQLEILEATKDMQHSKNAIRYEQEKARIDEITKKAINNKAKVTEAVNRDRETINKLKSYLDNSNKFIEGSVEVQKKAFDQSLSSELSSIHNTIKDIKSNNVKMAEYVSNNVSHFWNSGDIKFKSFTPEQFEKALANVEGETAQNVLRGMYKLDDVTNTYKKSSYLLWQSDSSLGINGVTDITNNPHDIVKYFNLSNHANAEMEEYYTGSVAENRKKAELKEIADKLRKVKDQQKNMSLDEKISVYRELNDSFNNPVEVQQEVEAQASKYTTVNDGSEIITGKGTTEQFKWVTEDEAALLGKDSLSQLRGTQLGDELFNLSMKKTPVENIVDHNKQYIDIINKASGNEELNFSRSQIKAGLESIDVLNSINDLFTQGTPQSVAEGKQALASYTNSSFIAPKRIEYEMRKLGLYGTIDDVNDIGALKEMTNNTIGAVVKYLDSADWDLINTIKEKTEYKERPDIVSHFQESLSENRREKIEMDRDYNGGGTTSNEVPLNKDGNRLIRTIGGQYDGEEEAWMKEIQKASLEYDATTRDFTLRNIALDNAKGEEIAIIQKRQVEFVNEYIKKTHVPVKLRNLGKNFSLEQLEKGYIDTILDNNNKPVPVQHFSEYYSLMSLNKLDETRSKVRPFTREEWDSKVIKIGDNTLPIRQFYEYYNQDIRKAQNDEIRAEINKHNETIRQQMDEHKITMREQTERANLDMLATKLNDKNNVNKKILEFLSDTPEIEDQRLIGNVLDKDGLISSIEMKMVGDKNSRLIRPSVDNFGDIIDALGIDSDDVPKGLFRQIDSVKGFDYYAELENTLIQSDKVVEKEYNSKLINTVISDQLSNDDVEAFYKYKQNDFLSATRNNRIMYVPKGADEEVIKVLNDVSANSNNRALHFKGDVLDYDVLEVGKDSFKVRPTDWIEANKTKFSFKFSDNFMETMKKANELQDEMKGYNNKTKTDFISHKNALKDGKLLIDGTTYSRMDLYNKMTQDMAYIDMDILDSNGNTTTKKIPIQKSALKVIDTNFTWMRKDPMLAGSLSADAEASVLEAIAEVSDVEVNDKFDLNRGAIRDGSKNVVDITEEAMSNRLKGKLLGNYINAVGGGDTGSAAIRGARIALEAENKPINVETVSDFLRTIIGPTERNGELSKYYSDIRSALNDKAYLKQAIESDITNITPMQSVSRRPILDDFDINDDETRRSLYGEDMPVEYQSESTKHYIDNEYKDVSDVGQELENKRTKLARNELIKRYGHGSSDIFDLVKSKYSRIKATEIVDAHIATLKKNRKADIGNSKVKDMILQNSKGKNKNVEVSKSLRKKIINLVQKQEEGALNKKIYKEFSKMGRIDNDNMQSLIKFMEKDAPGTLDEVSKYISNTPSMKKIKDRFVKRGHVDPMAIMNGLRGEELRISQEDFGVKLQSLREFVDTNGTDALIQHINEISDKGDPFSGIKKLISDKEIFAEAQNIEIKNLEQYKNLAFLSDLVPGFDIEVSGQTANGQSVSFNVSDAKPNYEGGSGLVVKDRDSGKWLPIVDTSPKTNKPVGLEEVRSLASIERSGLDSVKKSEMFKIEDVPIFLNKNGGLKTTIVPNVNFDFDKAANTSNGYGKLSPVQSLINSTKLLDEARNGTGNGATLDFETTGLPDKLDKAGLGHLFQPVQATTELFDLHHDGDKFNVGKRESMNYYLAPDDALVSHVEKLYGRSNVPALVKDLDGNDAGFLKNYAKYSMPEAAYKTKIMNNEKGQHKIFLSKEVTGEDGNITQQWVESKYTPNKYVRELQKNAKNVVDFLRSGGETGKGVVLQHEGKFYQRNIKNVPGIDLTNGFIYDNKADFMKDIINNSADATATIGHNLSGADIPWAKRWIKEATDGLDKELKAATLEGDETSAGIAKRFMQELNQPFLDNAVDTMHLGKVIEPGQSKFNLIDASNRNGVSVDGLAHLSDVDVPKNTNLFVSYANTDGMRSVERGIDGAVEIGDIIVKSGKSSDGLQLDRGFYKISGISQGEDGKVGLNLIDLANDNKDVSIDVNNMATLQRDAMETWTRFKESDFDIAKNLHNSLETVEANRTMKNAMTNLDTWMLHKQTGEDGGYGKMLDTFNSLKTKYDGLAEKAANNLTTKTVTIDGVEVPSMSHSSYTDEEKFLYENRHRFQGEGYVKELNRLSEEVPQRRINANKLEAQYMNSDEGKAVEHFLTESQNRLSAGVIDDKAFKKFNEGMRQTIHDTKLEAFQNGKMNDAMIIAPNKYNLGEINVDVLADKKLGGSAHGFGNQKLATIRPFDFTLDFTNSKTLSDSVWNTAGEIAKNMHYNKQVASMSEGRTVALNRYVMPLLQQKGLLPTDGDWTHISSIANNIVATDAQKVTVPSHMNNILPVAVNHMMDNKQAVTAKLAPLQEVNMMKGSSGEVLQAIQTKLNSQLADLDKNAATRVIGIESVHSPELQAVNKELVNIASINRQDAVKAIDGNYMPFYNYNIGSKNALAHIENLPNASEFNLKNPVSAELGMMTAEELKNKADSLVTDRELIKPYKFRLEAVNGNASRVAKAMPEYVDILQRSHGYDMDHISEINNDIANDLEKRVYKPLYNAQVQAKGEKAEIYQELSHRASASSKYNIHNADIRQLDLENADRTKFNAMLQLGWAQRYQDAQGVERVRAGKVGLPNQAPTSELLDPSKVLITSRAKIGSLGQNGAVGLAFTDLSIAQLDAIGKDQFTPNREKIMINEYLKQDGIEKVHTNIMAKQNLESTLSRRRAQQLQSSGMPESLTQSQDYISGLNANTVENGATRKPPASTPKPIMQSTVDDVIPESHFTQASRQMRHSINEVGTEARGIVREMMNSNAAKIAGIGLAFAGALALTRKQYTGDGGTADQKPVGDSAPRVDGTHAPEYNGTKHDTIPLPKQQKTVRVEENGKGMNVKVRAKNRGNIPDGDVTNAVSNAVNSVVKTDINIHQTDDRQSIDKGYVSNLFSQLLGGQ